MEILKEFHPYILSPVESEITKLFKIGDVRAMELLYDHYSETLYGVVYRMVRNEPQAQDIIQDSFVKIWKQSDTYDASKGRLFTWLMRIVRNQAIDVIRKNNRSGQIYGEASDVSLSNATAENVEFGTDYDIKKVFDTLDRQHKELIEHSYILGFTHPEIAEKFDLPLGTVKTRIRSAMIELRAAFGNEH